MKPVPDELTWVRHLPPDDVALLARELAEASEASVPQLLIEWQHTAEIHADPQLRAPLSNPCGGDYGPALPPDPLDSHA